MSHGHKKPITAAEFRELVKQSERGFMLTLADIVEEHAEHIALALEAMEERANSEVM